MPYYPPAGGPFVPLNGSVAMTGSLTTPSVIASTFGSAAAPAYAVNTNYGIFFDSTNTALGISTAGTENAWFTSAGLTLQRTGAGTNINMAGEGAVTTTETRYTNDGVGVNSIWRKARGTIATPVVVSQNDTVYQNQGAAYDGAAFQVISSIVTSIIQPTPAAGAMGSRLSFFATPLSSATVGEVMRLESATGLSMYGAFPVINADRTVIPNGSTTAALPAYAVGGLRYVSDLEAGSGIAYGGVGGVYRNIANGQVASATVTGAGVLSEFTGYCNFTYRNIVQTTMQMLANAGLLTKIGGLWVHAVPTNQTDGLLNWITPGVRPLTIVGTPTWTANQGFTGDGVSALLSTVTGLANFGAVNNSIMFGTYVRTPSTALAACIGMASAVIGRIFYLQSFNTGALLPRIEDTNPATYTPPRYTGMFTLQRNNSANFQISVDDSAQTTITRVSSGNANNSLAFLGTTDTTSSEFSTAQLSFSFCGGANLTAADIINLRAIMVDYYLVQIGAVTATVANLPPAANYTGQTYYVPNLGGGAALLQANATNWSRTDSGGYEVRALATGSETLTYLTNASNVEYTTNLTGNVSVTLGNIDAKGTLPVKGAVFQITLNQAAPGAFTFAVVDGVGSTTLITFPVSTNKAARFSFSGTNWRLAMDANL